VDYVFTDPPFGSNIFYSDMNLFHEAWLGTVTDHASEAVVHTTGKRKKDASVRYEALLASAFAEAFRVLKPGCYMSVVFGNSSGHIWGLVQRAIRDAGFKAAPAHVAILDKGQRSVKGLNSGSESVVTVDLILTVQKPEKAESADDAHVIENGDTQRLISEVIEELSSDEARNPSHVYARILRKAINGHYTLDKLHLSDVLLALHSAGYTTNEKTGLMSLKHPVQKEVELV
jgi:adenine-specific DNA methylase